MKSTEILDLLEGAFSSPKRVSPKNVDELVPGKTYYLIRKTPSGRLEQETIFLGWSEKSNKPAWESKPSTSKASAKGKTPADIDLIFRFVDRDLLIEMVKLSGVSTNGNFEMNGKEPVMVKEA